MKLSQAVKLGHQSLIGHKRRSLSVIITMSVLFGVLFGVNFIVQGLENTILQAADNASGKNYFINVRTNPNLCSTETTTDANGQIIFGESSCPELDILADITPVAEQYHGQVINFDYNILPIADARSFIQYDLSQLPDNVIPVITDLTATLALHDLRIRGNTIPYPNTAAVIEQLVPQLLGQVLHNPENDYDYAIVGILPSNDFQDLAIKRRVDDLSGNPLDLILSILPGGSSHVSGITVIGNVDKIYNVILVDDGSEYVASKRELFTGLYQNYYQNYRSAIVKFNNLRDASDFAAHWPSEYSIVYSEGQEPDHLNYTAFQVFTGQIGLVETFNFIKWLLSFGEIIIIAIAIIVMIFTCLKVISAESTTIQLYRSLGASSADLCLIYGWYLVELCLLAAGFAVLFGTVLSLITTMLNASALSQMLTAAYACPVTWPIFIFGWNWQITQILAVIILAAPVCLALCLPKLLKR